MVLPDYLLALLSVPLSDAEVTSIFEDQDRTQWPDALWSWLLDAQRLNPELRFEGAPGRDPDGRQLLVTIVKPFEIAVCFRFVDSAELRSALDSDTVEGLLDPGPSKEAFVVLLLCMDGSGDLAIEGVAALENRVERRNHLAIVLEPRWAAAMLVEQMRPLFWGVSADQSTESALGGAPTSPYFEVERLSPVEGGTIGVSRVRDQVGSLLAAVLDETGVYADKLRATKRNTYHEGTILLATTFLPTVTHSIGAVKRFYATYGAREETFALIEERLQVEEQLWLRHVRRHRRVDIVDRYVLEEYLAAPEYYQMPLTVEELQEQMSRLHRLLREEGYSLCLSPEAIDVCFEVRGGQVSIRTDRRNKGQPRTGRIAGLTLKDSDLADLFEREFWTLFRVTEPEFKEKESVFQWISDRAARYAGPSGSSREGEEYDVFLCHSSADKDEVRAVASWLRDRGLRPWFDEWCLIPGRPWQRALESEIGRIRSAAVFVGRSGLGPWSNLEMEAFMREFVRRDVPVIPVLLDSLSTAPQLPIFLQGMHWVDMKSPGALDELIVGIRGRRSE